jgi:hypothetical protein
LLLVSSLVALCAASKASSNLMTQCSMIVISQVTIFSDIIGRLETK